MPAAFWRQFHRALALSCALVGLAAASPAGDGQAVGALKHVILSEPSRLSTAYDSLRDAAKPSRIEKLEMSKSEVWSVSLANWDRFIAEAKRLGISFMVSDETLMPLLAPEDAQAAMSNAQREMMHDAMSSKAAMGMSTMQMMAPAMGEFALTQPEIVIPLTEGIKIVGRRASLIKTDSHYAWHGTVVETSEPITLLWWPTGKVTGTVTYKRRVYAVRNLGDGMIGVVKMNPDNFPEEHPDMSPDQKSKMHGPATPSARGGDGSAQMPDAPSDDPLKGQVPVSRPGRSELRDLQDAAPDGPAPHDLAAMVPLNIVAPEVQRPKVPVSIRVIVAYTAAAALHYADIKTDLIPLALEEANQSFRNSGVGNVQLELAYAYQTPYVEEGTHFEHVFRIAKDRDGYMDEVHALRDRYAADVGVLIVDDANGCGLAAQVFARAERAFAVVNHECAANMYSLGHEIGHLIGARHDIALDNSSVPFSFGHGFVAGKAWRSMMSYKDSCDGCIRLPLWSNPDAKVNGTAAGDAASDNARVIAEQAARVAGFR